MHTRLALLLFLVSTSLLACDGPNFGPEEILEKDRPMASRISVEGDATRATAGPGETAKFELLVGRPGTQVTWTYLFAVCHRASGKNGIGVCDPQRPIIASNAEPTFAYPPLTLPAIAFTVPAVDGLESDEQELLVQGLLCPGSSLDPTLLSAFRSGDLDSFVASPNPCADKGKNGLVIASPFRIERSPDDRNHTPVIRGVSASASVMEPPIALGESWLSTADADTAQEGCQGAGFLELEVDSDVAFLCGRIRDCARQSADGRTGPTTPVEAAKKGGASHGKTRSLLVLGCRRSSAERARDLVGRACALRVAKALKEQGVVGPDT